MKIFFMYRPVSFCLLVSRHCTLHLQESYMASVFAVRTLAYYIYFHPITSGVQKESLMKMTVCSTVFNSRQSALGIYRKMLQSAQRVSNYAPAEIMSYCLWKTGSTRTLC